MCGVVAVWIVARRQFFLSSPLQMLLVSAGDGQVAELGCPNVPGSRVLCTARL